MSDNSEKSKSEGTPAATSTTQPPSSGGNDSSESQAPQPPAPLQKKKSFASYLKNADKRKRELADLQKRQKEEQLTKEKLQKEEELKKLELQETQRKQQAEERKKQEEERREMELRLLNEIKKREQERKEEETRRNSQVELQRKEREEQERKLEQLKKEQDQRRKQDELKKLEQQRINQEQLLKIQEKRKADEKARLESEMKEKSTEVIASNEETKIHTEFTETTSNDVPTQVVNEQEHLTPTGDESATTKPIRELSKGVELSKIFDDEENVATSKSSISENEEEEVQAQTQSLTSSTKEETHESAEPHKSKDSIPESSNTGSIRSQQSSLPSVPDKLNNEPLSATLSQVSDLSSVRPKSSESQRKFLDLIKKSPVKQEEESPFAQTSPLTDLASEPILPPSSLERHLTNKRLHDYPTSIAEVSEHSTQSGSNYEPVDSDTETVHGDSPVKPRRGKLIRKRDWENSRSPSAGAVSRHLGFNDEEIAEMEQQQQQQQRQRTTKQHGKNKTHSRSISPKPALLSKKKVVRDAAGRTKLHKACGKGKYEEALALLDAGADVDDLDNAGNSALHESALQGHTDIVRLLLERGAKVDLQSGGHVLDTPLIDAVANGHLDTIKVLIEYGADPRIENVEGGNAWNSVNEDLDNHEVIKSLLREASLKFIAAEESQKSVDMVKNDDAKVEQGDTEKDGVNDEDDDDQSMDDDMSYRSLGAVNTRRNAIDVISRAGKDKFVSKCAVGDLQYVGLYLENGGEPIPEALLTAARHDQLEVMNLMVAFGANVNEYANDNTLLMEALGRGHLKTVKFLLAAGADPTLRTLDGSRSTLSFATDGLIVSEAEVRLIKEAIASLEAKKNPSASNPQAAATANTVVSESERPKKRKPTPLPLENDSEAPKKKKPYTADTPAITSRPVSREASATTSVQAKPDEVKQAKDMKRSLSSSYVNDTGSHKKLKPSADSSRAQSPAAPAAALESQSSNLSETATTPAAMTPSETEDEKKARLLKEKIDRERYEAEKEAKRKAREAEYMRNISNVEEQKRRELDVIRKREEEQQKKEAQLLELKKQQEQERKNLMSLKEEYERRRQIREQYPYGLEQATFDDDRTKEDLLPYLPLYCIDDGGESTLVSDVQVVILLGKEDFLTKYDGSLEKKFMSLDDKEKLFDFLYPFLGDFKGKPSTRAQQNDREVQLEKFKSLKLNWLRKDQVLQIIKQDFNPLYDTIRTRLEKIQWSEILTPDYTKQITPVNAYNGINPQEEQKVEQLANDRKIPIFLRNRRSLLKSLVANSKKRW